jgi:hypothetical protein
MGLFARYHPITVTSKYTPYVCNTLRYELDLHTLVDVKSLIAMDMLYSLMAFPLVMSLEVPTALNEWYNPNTCSYCSKKNSRHSNN